MDCVDVIDQNPDVPPNDRQGSSQPLNSAAPPAIQGLGSHATQNPTQPLLNELGENLGDDSRPMEDSRIVLEMNPAPNPEMQPEINPEINLEINLEITPPINPTIAPSNAGDMGTNRGTPSPNPPAWDPAIDTFPLSPLIRITLLLLYGGLTVPLPFLAAATQAPISPIPLTLGLGIGAVLLQGALSERVEVTPQGIRVSYPQWIQGILGWGGRRGWFLPWEAIQSLKPRSTGQGGLVYYLVSRSGEGYLLPMRIAGFARFVRHVQAHTGIDTSLVRPLAQPWMYFILLGVTLILGLVDAWTIATALPTLTP